VAILTLALMAAGALVAITTRMEKNSALMWNALESVLAAEKIEIALLRHSRARRLLGLTGEEHHAAEMQEQEQELRKWLAEAHKRLGSSEEEAVLQELKKRSEEYLALTAQLMTQGRESLAGHHHLVDRVLPTSDRLVEINRADASRAREETQHWDNGANTLGGLVAVALLAGISLSLWLMRRNVYQPLLSIRRALVHFHPGSSGVVAPEIGALELREIAHEFNRMTERLERQREVQLGFIAGVAHDLRNPLSALKLSAAAVRPDRPLPPEEKVRERFEVVLRQVGRIERMVEDLLDTARIEAGKLELRLETHDLAGLVREAVALHEGVSPAHQLVFQSAEEPLLVRCDSTRISQVLNNLLSNAIKYSPQGGPVRIELTSAPDAAWVSVTDSGVGIAAEERESIFEPFRRSSTTRDTIPGVGLGLAVGRRIIEAHGGHIELRSELGVGTTFRFRLPREPRHGG
jgi:signal transduction histidine kinase